MGRVGSNVVSVWLKDSEPEDEENESEDTEDNRNDYGNQLSRFLDPHLGDPHFERNAGHTGHARSARVSVCH
jgi:hypothetical protein